MTTKTGTAQQSSNGWLFGAHEDLSGHNPDDVLVTIYVKDKHDNPGRRVYYTDARRLHRVTCRFVTKNMQAWKSGSAFQFRDSDAARWAGEAPADGTPLHTCTVCGTDTLEPGVTYWGETYAEAKARRDTRDAARAAEQTARFAREAAEARVRNAERRAVAEVLAKYNSEVEALAAQYLAETEA